MPQSRAGRRELTERASAELMAGREHVSTKGVKCWAESAVCCVSCVLFVPLSLPLKRWSALPRQSTTCVSDSSTGEGSGIAPSTLGRFGTEGPGERPSVD